MTPSIPKRCKKIKVSVPIWYLPVSKSLYQEKEDLYSIAGLFSYFCPNK